MPKREPRDEFQFPLSDELEALYQKIMHDVREEFSKQLTAIGNQISGKLEHALDCPHCGRKILTRIIHETYYTIQCQVCGQEVSKLINICPNCGSNLKEST